MFRSKTLQSHKKAFAPLYLYLIIIKSTREIKERKIIIHLNDILLDVEHLASAIIYVRRHSYSVIRMA